MKEDRYDYFTLVFKGDIRKFKENPMNKETCYGIPVASGVGNAFCEIEDLHDELDKAEEKAWMYDDLCK